MMIAASEGSGISHADRTGRRDRRLTGMAAQQTEKGCVFGQSSSLAGMPLRPNMGVL